jgi:hypothetical protein
MRIYTRKQLDIALGILSGRIDPDTDLRSFDDAQRLWNWDLVSTMQGGDGNPGTAAHRRKAEKILEDMLLGTASLTPTLDSPSVSQESHYGICPKCGGLGVSRERRINGNDICENGHTYKSSEAL